MMHAVKRKDKGERINALWEHVLTEKLASPFSSRYELSTLVLAAVSKYLEEKNVSTVAIIGSETTPHRDRVSWPPEKSPLDHVSLIMKSDSNLGSSCPAVSRRDS